MKKNYVFLMSLLLGLVFIFACKNNILEFDSVNNIDQKDSTKLKADEAYISFRVHEGIARSILPTINPKVFTDFKLIGLENGTEKEFGTFANYDELIDAHVISPVGTWDFVLTARKANSTFIAALKSQELKAETNNILTFQFALKSFGASGDIGMLDVKVAIPSGVKKVKTMLYSLVDNSEVQEFTKIFNEITDGHIVYKKEAVPVGDYMLKIFAYGDESGTMLIAQYNEYVQIASGLTSAKDLSITELNHIYTLTIDWCTSLTGKANDVYRYSRFSDLSEKIQLTKVSDLSSVNGFIPLGWYEKQMTDMPGCGEYYEKNNMLDAVEIEKTPKDRTVAINYYKTVFEFDSTTTLDDALSKTFTIEATKDVEWIIVATSGISGYYFKSTLNKYPNRKIILDLSKMNENYIALSALSYMDNDKYNDTLVGIVYPSTSNGICRIVAERYRNLKRADLSKVIFTEEQKLDGNYLKIYEEIIVPNGCRYISREGFSENTALKYIDLSNTSIKEIPYRAFGKCTNLENIKLPTSLTKIGAAAFRFCSNLKTIDIPASASLTEIGEYAFDNCSNLKTIDIPASLTKIGEYAFCKCSNLKTIHIPASLTEIGRAAFAWSGLENIDMSFCGVTEIDYDAFKECKNLKWVKLPSCTREIETRSFENCESLRYVMVDSYNMIPKSIYTNFEAFRGCSKLCLFLEDKKQYYSSSLSEIIPLDRVFRGPAHIEGPFLCAMTLLEDIYWLVMPIEDLSGDIQIPLLIKDNKYGVAFIAEGAFEDCTQITSVTIHDWLRFIGKHAFRNCTKLESVYFGKADNWETAGRKLSSVDLSQPSKAKELLTDTYVEYSWYRPRTY